MRDDIPPDELNRAPEPGLNFGFPYCHASTISDAEFGAGSHPCRDSTGGARTYPAAMEGYSVSPAVDDPGRRGRRSSGR
ncbi:MAG: hypothetical protein PWR21_429 [Methanoculleus sp.]|nr:hypothetical protein [Methanoculleus sp.]MDK2988786.1 hypothetical protein [Methanoculleus sp.]